MAVRLEQLREGHALLGRHAAAEAVGDADLRRQRDGIADFLAYGARHLAGEPGATSSDPPQRSLRRLRPGARNDEIR